MSLKEAIIIGKAEEGVVKYLFSDPKTIKNIETEVQIFSNTTKITSKM